MMRRMGRPGLVGTMARTAVIAGTATAVFPVPPATLRSISNAMVAPITEDHAANPGP